MAHFTQKWTIIKLLEPIGEGTEFFWKEWPLHITLADVFAVDWTGDELVANVSPLAAQQKPIELTVTGYTHFGPPDGQIKVALLDMPIELRGLHNNLIDLLETGNVTFNSPQYVRDGYVAHSTVQKQARLKPGDKITVDEFTIVDMFPHHNGEWRRIVKTIPFQNNHLSN